MGSSSWQSYKAGEIDYKISLSKQIDRIAMLFSEKPDQTRGNMNLEQSIMIDTKLNAVNCLERMIQPYIDDIYRIRLATLKQKYNMPIFTFEQKMNFIEEKLGEVLECMDRNRLLIEQTIREVKEGFDEETGSMMSEGEMNKVADVDQMADNVAQKSNVVDDVKIGEDDISWDKISEQGTLLDDEKKFKEEIGEDTPLVVEKIVERTPEGKPRRGRPRKVEEEKGLV